MSRTQVYGLNQHAQTDFYNVDDFNENADIIEAELAERVRVVLGFYTGTGTIGVGGETMIPVYKDLSTTLLRLDIVEDGYLFGEDHHYGPCASLSVDLRGLGDRYQHFTFNGTVFGVSIKKDIQGDIVKSVQIIADRAYDTKYETTVAQMNAAGETYWYALYYLDRMGDE